MRAWLLGLALLLTSPAGARQPTLASLSGDVTVVVFWASWCAPCRQELPLVEALHQKYKDDTHVRVVAVSVDTRHQAHAARKLAAELGLTTPLIVDEALYGRFFGVREIDVPRLAVVDRAHVGLDRNGALAGEKAEGFVRDVSAAIESVRAGAPRPPTMQWRPLTVAHP